MEDKGGAAVHPLGSVKDLANRHHRGSQSLQSNGKQRATTSVLEPLVPNQGLEALQFFTLTGTALGRGMKSLEDDGASQRDQSSDLIIMERETDSIINERNLPGS